MAYCYGSQRGIQAQSRVAPRAQEDKCHSPLVPAHDGSCRGGNGQATAANGKSRCRWPHVPPTMTTGDGPVGGKYLAKPPRWAAAAGHPYCSVGSQRPPRTPPRPPPPHLPPPPPRLHRARVDGHVWARGHQRASPPIFALPPRPRRRPHRRTVWGVARRHPTETVGGSAPRAAPPAGVPGSITN